MKVKFSLSIGYFNASQEGVFNVDTLGFSPDEWKNLTEVEKQEQALEWANNYIEISYEEVKD